MKRIKSSLLTFFILYIPTIIFAAEEGGGHAGGGEAHSEEIKMLIYNAINFILLVALLVVLLRKPLAKFLRENSANVAKDIEEAAKMREDAQKRFDDLKQRMDRLDVEISEMKEQLRKEGEIQGEKILERSRQAIERIREDAKFQADQQVKMARKTLQEEAARLAVEAAEEILKKSVNDKDHERLVGQFLREVK